MTNAPSLARGLGSSLTTAHPVPLPLLTADDTAPFEKCGAAYFVIPRKKNDFDQRWFRELPGMPTTLVGDVTVLVHWPSFLTRALFPAKPRADLAHHTLEFLLPVIEQYDSVLADDVRVFRAQYAQKSREECEMLPLWLGQETDDDEARFNAHLTELLGNESFLVSVRRTMERSLAAAVYRRSEIQHLPLSRELARFTTVFWPKALLDGGGRGFRSEPVHPDNYGPITDPWMWELRRLVDGFSGSDGCWYIPRAGPHCATLLVNWAAVVALAQQQQRKAIFISDEIGVETRPDVLGPLVKDAFARRTHGKYAAARHKAIYEIGEALGLSIPDALETPWELYNYSALVEGLAGYCRRAARARRIAAHRQFHNKEPKPMRHRILDILYEGQLVMATRRCDEVLFSVPFEYPLEYDDRKFCAKKRYKFAGQVFWTQRGLNLFCNGVQDGKFFVPPVPAATPFRLWAEVQSLALIGRSFTEALFAQGLGQRMDEKQRGVRKHLGRFTEPEDQELRVFFENRSPGPLTAKERTDLTALIPGRSLSAVIRRREQLGEEFAVRHGYKAYEESGYCAGRSYKRRRRWFKEGVAP